jgi:hypothetical protein
VGEACVSDVYIDRVPTISGTSCGWNAANGESYSTAMHQLLALLLLVLDEKTFTS